ncbi:hypothetical protein [Massilia sp.]|uniref:hypothetical protein n=1 Tax=Massilia sp. TaxID=1882437 RepID=UPI0028A01AAF|nr:hypothetical protein [Massilia sp.]
MIFIGLLFGAALALVAATFWKDLVDWLKRVVEKVREVVAKVVAGVKIFVRKVGEAIKEIAKSYSQDEQGRWQETIVTREVSESDVPKDILDKVKRQRGTAVDVTKELELELEG